jgi:hypothetical protein
LNYFTLKWLHSDTEDADHNVFEKYREHLAPLLPQWSSDVQTLANCTNLHDGFVRELSGNRDKATLFLRLRCGDLRVGYFDLDLHYSGALFSPFDWTTLSAMKAERIGRKSEALYDEVDEEDGLFVHRILFFWSRKVRSCRRSGTSRRIKTSRRVKASRRINRLSRYREVVIRFQHLRLVTTPRRSRFDASE